MPRTARLEFPGACYHVINRGNYRADIFESDGARESFEKTLFEACERSKWRLHAYVIMRNHFHLALETPEPNLSQGMKWLQGTWVSRFNRLRRIVGRPFQGRFKSLLVEPGHALGEVCHYIHLNPVRAKIVSANQLAKFRWSSLHYYLGKRRPEFLDGFTARSEAGSLPDTKGGWRKYLDYLAFRCSDDPAARQMRFKKLSRGWSIGSDQFREDMRQRVKEQFQTGEGRFVGMSAEDWAAERARGWQASLEQLAELVDLDLRSIQKAEKSSDPNKVLLAYLLKTNTDASNTWIAEALNMGKPATVSQYVRRFKLAKRDQNRRVRSLLSKVKQCPV